jgi:hypothetical protein
MRLRLGLNLMPSPGVKLEANDLVNKALKDIPRQRSLLAVADEVIE